MSAKISSLTRATSLDLQSDILAFVDSSDLTMSPTGTTKGITAGNLSQSIGIVNVKNYGAALDDSTDDTAAIQAAIDSVGSASGVGRAGVDLLVPGPAVISDTLTIARSGIRLVGNGWGHRDDTGPRRSYLRWNGLAGSPMVRFRDCYYGPAGISRLKLMGNTSAKPSCAIELNEDTAGIPNQNIHLSDVYIGGFSGETGDGVQFTRGIEWTGTKINNAEQLFENIYITGCSGAALYQNSIQAVNIRIDHGVFYFCGVGLHVTGAISGNNLVFLGNTIDIETPFDDGVSQCEPRITIQDYYSELSGRMFEGSGAARLHILSGRFQLSDTLNADGKVIKHEVASALYLRLQDFQFTQPGSAPSTAPFLALRTPVAGATDKTVILDGVSGWVALTGGTNGLDIATRGATDRRYIYFLEHYGLATSSLPRVAQNFVTGTDVNWDITRFDIPGPLTLGGSITTSAPTGGAGAWELGVANSVSPTSPNRTLTVEIDGTAYYIHAKTTND